MSKPFLIFGIVMAFVLFSMNRAGYRPFSAVLAAFEGGDDGYYYGGGYHK